MVFAWYGFLAIMAILFERKTRWISRFSIFSVFLGALFIRYGIMVPPSDQVNETVTGIAIGREALNNYYVALVLVYVVVFLTVTVLDPQRPPSSVGPARSVNMGLLWTLTGAVLALLVVVWIIIPWDQFASGLRLMFSSGHTAADYSVHRAEYGNETISSVSIINYLAAFARYAVMPVLVWILFFARKQHTLNWALFLMSLGILELVGLSSGQKAPTLTLLLGFIFAGPMMSRRSLLNWRVSVGLAAALVVALPILFHLQYPSLDLASLYQSSIYRLTGEYSRTAQLRFIFYPDIHPFLVGLSSPMVRGVGSILGMNVSGIYSPETYLPIELSGVGTRYSGTWNAGFFAEAWADFGFLGVVVTSALVGAILSLIYRWFENSSRGYLESGTYVALCISAIYLTDVALLTALWTFGLISGFIVYGLLRLGTRSRPKRGQTAELSERMQMLQLPSL